MERDTIIKILGEDFDSDKVSKLLNAFHSELTAVKELAKENRERADIAESQLKDSQKQIKELESSVKQSEDKDGQIAQYLEEIQKLKEENKMSDIDHYETMKLTMAGAFDVDLCKKALDYDRTQIQSDEDFSLIDDAITSQMENKGFLFHPKEEVDTASKSEGEVEKKKNHYEPRKGNRNTESKDGSLGKRMAEEIMSGRTFGIS